MSYRAGCVAFCLLFAALLDAVAQNLIPNGSFETGTSAPASWSQIYGNGAWETTAHTGTRSVSLSGTIDCGNLWRTTDCPVTPGAVYVAKCWLKGSKPLTQQAFFGWDQVKRYVSADEVWRRFQLFAVMPANLSFPRFSIGQCRAGKIFADDVEVKRALPLQFLATSTPLGFGEKLAPGKLVYQSLFSNATSIGLYSHGNYAPCLHAHTAGFDTWYWDLRPGTYVIYRHGIPSAAMTNAAVSVTSYYSSGPCEIVVEVSHDATNWTEAARLPLPGAASRSFTNALPASFFPTTNLFVRLTSTGNAQVHKYGFEASVPDNQIRADGKTWFFEVDQGVFDTSLFGMVETSTGWVCRAEFRNPHPSPRPLSIAIVSDGPAGSRTNTLSPTLPSGTSQVIDLPLASAGAGENVARIHVTDSSNGSTLLKGSLPFTVPALHDRYFGYGLPSPAGADVWWCESTRKVSRLPRETTVQSQAVEIAAARNEYEPFQLVLRSPSGLTNARVQCGDLLLQGQPEAGRIAATNIEVCLVEYVNVWQASDYSGTTGEHPDALLPLTNSFSIPADTNQPLWVTVYVPKDTPAGWYDGTLSIESDTLAPIVVPLSLRVYNFTLPDTTHTRTAYKSWLDADWHKTASMTTTQKRAVWDLYMDNFRKHRITPTHPHNYAPITWTLSGDTFTLNTTDFDAAMSRYLDEFGFNGFNVIDRMDSINGYWKTTPEYSRLLAKLLSQIMEHLRSKGWDKKAYIWWYDEPNSGIYPHLIRDMKVVQEAAPDLKRVTTYQPDPPIYGSIDTWVPMMTPFRWLYNKMVPRQNLNEEIWWYIACWPAYPFANNYIDHPGINHRIRTWMAERYDVRGDLYWSTSWYKTTGGLPRNPWLDPMCVSAAPLGNGDGMLLYPPVRTLPTSPVLQGPLNSIRWELLRESMEDSEYFWLLRRAKEEGLAGLGLDHPAVIEADQARDQATALVRALDDFDKDPVGLELARRRVASAIEALSSGKPWIVNQPVSKAAQAGSSVDLRVEAVGWPLPQYVWYHNGSPVPGGTNSVLRLTPVNSQMEGKYSVIISNVAGKAVSTEVALVVRNGGLEAPRIIAEPRTVHSRLGERVVLSTSVSGSAPISYQWHYNGVAMLNATNTTLLFTNLAATNFGSYHVVISNMVGVSTSAQARIISIDAPLLWMDKDPHTHSPIVEFTVRGRSTTLLTSTNLSGWSVYGTFKTPSSTLRLLEPSDSPIRYYKVRTD